jgi:hypothetical protein
MAGYFSQLKDVEKQMATPKQRQADKIAKAGADYKAADKKAKYAKSPVGMTMATVKGMPGAAKKVVKSIKGQAQKFEQAKNKYFGIKKYGKS